MGGSESKATVLECMIKNLKKGFGGDYGVKMKPNHLHILCEGQMAPYGSRMATREHHELKNSGSIQESQESQDTWINIHILTHG